MKKLLLAVLLLVAYAGTALADVKIYQSTPPRGKGGDRLGKASNLCPTFRITPGAIQGFWELTDTGGGTVTMTDLTVYQPADVDLITTTVFGPGSFIFIKGGVSSGPAVGTTGSGTTTTTIAWGLTSGWAITGGETFCSSSPTSTCSDNGFAHGLTVPPVQPSATYDMGTWTFDAAGDFEAADFIQRTSNGGISNVEWDLRSSFVGAGIPALPLVGFGAMALGLVAVGARTLLRKK